MEEAKKACRLALRGMRKPEVVRLGHIDALVTTSDLGSILVRAQQYPEAVSVLWGVLEAIVAALGHDSFDSIMTTGRLGVALLGAGRYGSAEQYLCLSAEKWTNLYG
jgi:ABC-type proline/glycine betaine transport system permease subunit